VSGGRWRGGKSGTRRDREGAAAGRLRIARRRRCHFPPCAPPPLPSFPTFPPPTAIAPNLSIPSLKTSCKMALTMKQSARVQVARSSVARKPVVVRAASAAAGDVPSPEKRGTMNLILAAGIGAPVAGLAVPVSVMRRARARLEEKKGVVAPPSFFFFSSLGTHFNPGARFSLHSHSPPSQYLSFFVPRT
jgi:hypothetical protein